MNVDWTKVKVYLTNADLIDIVSDSVGIPDINRICDNWVSKLEKNIKYICTPSHYSWH